MIAKDRKSKVYIERGNVFSKLYKLAKNACPVFVNYATYTCGHVAATVFSCAVHVFAKTFNVTSCALHGVHCPCKLSPLLSRLRLGCCPRKIFLCIHPRVLRKEEREKRRFEVSNSKNCLLRKTLLYNLTEVN